MKKFTLVSTIFNEAKRLEQSLQEIERQTITPDEIIITDAGSTDGSIDILNAYAAKSKLKIRVIVKKGCAVAEGRNIAIENAANDLIVSTDFGCQYEPNWLETLIKYFDNPEIEVVGGAFTVNETEIKTAAARADYILQNGYKVKIDETFSVSSRSIAYYKYVWTKIGGYNEWLTLAADDTIFWREIKQQNFRYKIDSKPLVKWNRHTTARQFAREAGRYGLGDGESQINFRNFLSNVAETAIRYSIIPFTVILLIVKNWWLTPLYIIMIFGLRSYFRAIKNVINLHNPKYGFGNLPMCFYMIETQRIAYIFNYIKGWLFKSSAQKTEQQKLTVK